MHTVDYRDICVFVASFGFQSGIKFHSLQKSGWVEVKEVV